jgi:uncharacterized protein (DUF1697 family)
VHPLGRLTLDTNLPALVPLNPLAQYIAFLRGINLGRRRPKMDHLRSLFVELKFTDVTTFLASGNVVFTSKTGDQRQLVKKIQDHLHQALGYEVDTFVRTRAEVAAAAAFRPFSKAELENPSHTVHVVFLNEAHRAGQEHRLAACRTEVDEFCANGREFYWLCRININESKVWSSPAIKDLALPSVTMRNLTTVRKLANLFPAG